MIGNHGLTWYIVPASHRINHRHCNQTLVLHHHNTTQHNTTHQTIALVTNTLKSPTYLGTYYLLPTFH